MSLNVVKFPDHYAALDIPDALRVLADEIEEGEHGACFNLLWVIDTGDGAIDLGVMGNDQRLRYTGKKTPAGSGPARPSGLEQSRDILMQNKLWAQAKKQAEQVPKLKSKAAKDRQVVLLCETLKLALKGGAR